MSYRYILRIYILCIYILLSMSMREYEYQWITIYYVLINILTLNEHTSHTDS